MNRLTITDLERSEQLDRPTMAAVRGGWKLAPSRPAYGAGDAGPGGTHDTTVTATQHPVQARHVAPSMAAAAATRVDGGATQDGESTRGRARR